MKEVTWKTLDGRVLPINKMTDLHLVNTIAMLRKSGRSLKLPAMEEEAKSRNLTEAMILTAPHPWQDVDGKWKHGLDMEDKKLVYKTVGR